jgi:hypothetical protein
VCIVTAGGMGEVMSVGTSEQIYGLRRKEGVIWTQTVQEWVIAFLGSGFYT